MDVSKHDLVALLPLIITGATTISVMLAIAIRRDHRLTLGLTAVGLLTAFETLPAASRIGVRHVTGLLIVDRYGLFLIGLFLLAALAVAFMSYGTLQRRQPRRSEEFYILLLTATFGAEVTVTSNHFASFIIGLETLAISLIAMVAYPLQSHRSTEAGIKYLILAGASSAFLLLGIALIYARFGTLSFAELSARLAFPHPGGLAIAGFALVIVGVGFKLSLVPFHMWAPDVYEGSPAPVAGFLSTVSKGAVLGFLLRFFVHGMSSEPLMIALSAMAALSMLAGNLLALMQQNVKRLLAYSSIAHLGYMLVALIAGGALAASAIGYYLASYFVMTLGAFAVISICSEANSTASAPERDRIADYRGLFWRQPWLATAFTLSLLALAGIPLTMGFVAKFFAIAAGVSGAHWPLVIILVIGSAIGLYYYLRLIITMFATDSGSEPAADRMPAAAGVGGGVLMILIAALIGFGIYPGPVLVLVRQAALSLI